MVAPLAAAAARWLLSTGFRTAGNRAIAAGARPAYGVVSRGPWAGQARIWPGRAAGIGGGALVGNYFLNGGTGQGMSAEDIFANMENFGPAGNYDQFGAAGGFSAPSMGAATMAPSTINFNMAAPKNPSGALANAAKRAYQPAIKYAKSVIPYYENREEASKGEIKDLRNIAEASWIDTAGRIREGTEAAVAQQQEGTAETMAALEQGVAGRTEGMDDFMASIGATVENANQAVSEEGTAGTALAAAEGSIFSGLLNEQGMSSANYADTLAGLQDTAAAADIALLRQNMSELIFRQQGRIADAKQAQAVAMMQAAIQGQQMYQQAYNQYVGMQFDAASMNANMAMEAAKFNASSQNEAARFNAGMAMAAQEAAYGAAGGGNMEMGSGYVGAVNNTKAFMMGNNWSPEQIDQQVNAFSNARSAVMQHYANQGIEPNEQLLIRDMQAVLQSQGIRYDPNAFQVFVNSGL